MKRYGIAGLLGFLLWFLAPPLPRGQDEPVLVDEIVARINSDIITLSALRRAQAELRQELEQQGLRGEELERAYREASKTLLQQLIDNQLLVQRANELGITVETQINEFLLNWGRQQGIPPAEVEKRLAEAGLDPDQVRQTLRLRFLREAVLAREVYSRIFQNIFDRDVEQYYQQHREEFTEPETVRLSEIFISTQGRSREQALAIVREIQEKLKAGADFGDLAVQYSARPSARNKGDIGTFTLGPRRTLGDAQAKAIEGLKVGDVSPPIELPDGFQLLKVTERQEARVRPLDAELKRQIQMRLAQQRAEGAIREYIETLRRDAYIWIAPAYREQYAAAETTTANPKKPQ
ncbi:MAG: peptidyl-prolyl cis-trans isomerase [Blastocatellia bacterium]|nr:peptidyl-prolyl cis-trans isomerase [Blastocatellia bacterium]MCS7157601.1 peptidyl-prolyl cis-trans isomerase [Blastocatellia bacterium]MCX7751866.1 peptidyl-prolyl cis-trans isomerase [Blastocatellia bacterium]MDW8166972.1 peptidyl-prolyl cis-trans isomerase [Acidobacteriota bacterium]MDW8257076.1 peptidyl-prolyl cis-trans isomerase [Acidobacteriota bacterium]